MRRRIAPVPAAVPAATLVVASLVSATSLHAAERLRTVRPVPTPALPARATVLEVQNAYDRTEKDVEAEYAKLIQEASAEKSALGDKIKQIDRQIEALKNEIRRIELLQKKIEELLPKILAFVGSDSAGGFGAANAGRPVELTALLAGELGKAGVSIPPDQLAGTAAAITKGGPNGMAAAWGIVLQIARAGSSTPRERLGPHAFPDVSSADLSNAASLPPGSATAFLLGRVSQQAAGEIKRLDDAIDSLRKESKRLAFEINTLEAQIAKVEAERAKAIEGLKTQRAKALEEANRLRSPAAIRLAPAATPTPARR